VSRGDFHVDNISRVGVVVFFFFWMVCGPDGEWSST
jgi:hypothetical protein